MACQSRRHYRRKKPGVPNVGFNPLVTDGSTLKQVHLGDPKTAAYAKLLDREGQISRLENIAVSTFTKLNKVLRNLGLPDLVIPPKVEYFGTTLVLIEDISSIHSVYGKLPFGIALTNAETAQLKQVQQVYSLVAAVWASKLRLEYLVGFYDEKIAGTIPNIKFLPLILTCFIFPFRVGKSIYEIAAKKESKNALVSS